MRIALLAATVSVCMAAPALARPHVTRPAPNPADIGTMPRLPSQPAFEATAGGTTACNTGARLLSHAAYVPGDDKARSVPCGQPLSTDTLMASHHWNQT